MSTTAFRIWSARLDELSLTKHQIGQFARAISRRALGRNARGFRTALTDEEAIDLYRRILASPVYLTAEHASQGVTWLAKYGAKALGMPAGDMTARLAAFDHFTWNGAVRIGTPRTGGNFTLPVWTVHQYDGTVWQYFNASWITRTYDGASDPAWWEGVEAREPVDVETDYELEVWSEDESLANDAQRVMSTSDHEIESWQAFTAAIRGRTERIRERKLT